MIVYLILNKNKILCKFLVSHNKEIKLEGVIPATLLAFDIKILIERGENVN